MSMAEVLRIWRLRDQAVRLNMTRTAEGLTRMLKGHL